MADIKWLIGNRIRDLRREKGLSQEKLGSKAKLHYTYIGAVERGEKNVSVLTLDKITRALGIRIGEIFSLPMDVEDPNKLKASMLKEIDKSDPEIIKVALVLIKELNALKTKPRHQKRPKRH